VSTFNDEAYIEEFKSMVQSWGIKTALEIGYGSSELVEALRSIGIDAEGIDQSTELSQGKQAPYLHNVSLDNFETYEKYDLVYSSGVLEHYDSEQITRIIGNMISLSGKYVLNIVPNTDCVAYRNAKKKTTAPWKDEADFTDYDLEYIHKSADLVLVGTGFLGQEWTKRFGPEISDSYLVYCLAAIQE